MKKLLIFTFLFFPLVLCGQPFHIKKIKIEDGLSNNYVVDITQDKRGFLWFATESGLNRFDGKKFKLFKKNSLNVENRISSNEINKIYADKTDDLIWIGTPRDGLNVFDCKTEKFTYYDPIVDDSTSIGGKEITGISSSSDGNIWISTFHNGVDCFDKRTGKFIHYNKSTVPALPSNNVLIVKEDKLKNLYIGHGSSGLSILSLKNKKVRNFTHNPKDPNSLPGNHVRTIFIDNINNVWIGTNNGLALFIPSKESFIVFKKDWSRPESLAGNYIFAINQMQDDRLWIGSEQGGISILDIYQNTLLSPQSVTFKNIGSGDDETCLSNGSIRSIFQDSFNNIWIGSYGGGVNFVSNTPRLFNSWNYSPISSKTNRLSNQTAWGICADQNNQLWIGTDGGGIDLFSNQKNIKNYCKDEGDLTDNAVLAAYKDSENNLWFGTYKGGVNVYDTKQNKFIHNILQSDKLVEARCFYEDKDKNMWIGCNEGIYVYNLQTGYTKLFTTENSGLAEYNIRSIAQDYSGRLWVGFFGRGLYIYDTNLTLIKRFNKGENTFPTNTVNHIYRDFSNKMWIATSEALVCFDRIATDNFNYTLIDENKGLRDNHIRAIVEDEQNNIWISTNGGISRYIPRLNRIYNYDHFEGIPAGNFMSGSVTKTADGTIYFGSESGVTYFHPANIPVVIPISPTIITEFKTYNNWIELPNNEVVIPVKSFIELPYNQNTFTISFNVLNYSLNHLVEYACILDGLEDKWVVTRNDNAITFRNIPHGKYEFKIKSRIRNQEWTGNISSVRIIIHPPFWLTWWAKAIYMVIIGVSIFLLIRSYKRKLDLENTLVLEKKNHAQEQNLNNERLRFFTNITHELRTPLTLIIGPLEDLQVDTSLLEKHRIKISVIYRSSTKLLSLINQLLEFRKTETQNKNLCVRKGNLCDLVNEVGLKYQELNTNKKITFQILFETEKSCIYYDSDIVSTVLDNLLSNAFKYTEKGVIKLILRAVESEGVNYIEFEVCDTGKGISEEDLPRIFDRYYQAEQQLHVSGTGIGLALVNNLVSIHQGSIAVSSQLDKGTSFRFRILADNIYPDSLHQDSKDEEKVLSEEISKSPVDTSQNEQIVLVIDDNEEIREYIESSLSANYKILTADNGKDGLDKAFKYIPDIIISDVMMPQIDGFELSKILKENVQTSHIPIILLTAKDTIQDKAEGYSIGVESYITKPFSARLLQIRITNLLESRKRMAELVRNEAINKESLAIAESLSTLDREFIEKVTSIIEDNISSNDIDVEFIADKVFVSHSSLYRKIKALAGISVNEFIRKVRLRNAERLLLTGKYTISEVSYRIGISSPTYFRQCFKDEFGMPPSEYMKQKMQLK